MWPFKRRPESPQEIAAERKLDEATREVAAEELDKEAAREQQAGLLGPFDLAAHREKPMPMHHVEGDPVLEPVDDPDPGDEHGLRETLEDDDAKS